MPQGVVNLLETVEVEEQQTRLPPLPMGELQALLPQHDEATTVGDAGQLVQDSQLNGGQLMLHHARQIHQQGPLTLIQLTRPAIDKAEGAHLVATGDMQRRSGIETDVGVPQHQGIVGETWIPGRILHHEDLFAEDGMATEGDVAWSLLRIQTTAGLEPLPFLIHQGDERDGHLEHVARHPGNAIETLLRRAIQNGETAQAIESLSFVFGYGRCLHGKSRRLMTEASA